METSHERKVNPPNPSKDPKLFTLLTSVEPGQCRQFGGEQMIWAVDEWPPESLDVHVSVPVVLFSRLQGTRQPSSF